MKRFFLAGAFIASIPLGAQDTTPMTFAPLPEGNNGIAAKYLNDAGIEGDSSVLFTDDFELSAVRFSNNWGGTVLTQQPHNVHGGKQSLECTLPYPRPNKETGKGVGYALKDGQDVLFLRYYAKYSRETELYHGGTHNGGAIGAVAPGVPEAEPGVPADGRRKFGILLDTYRATDSKAPSPGRLAVYVYHPEQRHQWGEHFYPTGEQAPYGYNPNYFGPQFVKRADLIPEQDRWICYELMVKANTPGKRDGRIAFWIDGRLTGDFMNLRLRDVETLKSNRFSLGLYTQNGAIVKPCAMWYDDVVVATSYIGPVAKRKKSGPARSAEEMAQARQALAKGDWAKAWRHFDKVDSEDLLRDAQENIRKIDALIRSKIGDAKALEAIGEKADALEAYRQVLREFPGIPAAEAAKIRIESLKSSR